MPSSFKALNSILPFVELVSLDIFDTAVFRLVRRPKDLFKILERCQNLPFLAQNRRLAARLVRTENKKNGVEEITLEEIYQTLRRLDPSISAEKAQEIMLDEIELELRLCKRNEEIGTLFDYLKKAGKKIGFTSDMYLPRSIIEQILEKTGFTGYDFLFVSSEDKTTKKTGRRFDCSISPELILHIGDNKKTDFELPLKKGLNAFLYKRTFNGFLSARLIKKLKTQKDLFFNFTQSLIMQKDFKSYWHSCGYQYAAPLLVCFSEWLNKEIQKEKSAPLCFLARDGMIMQKVYQTVFPDSKSLYLYTSRFLTGNEEYRQTYLDYFKDLKLSENHFFVVDVGRKGTIQNILAQLMPKAEITGYYVDLRSFDTDKRGFYVNAPKKYKRFLDFLDFLFIAPSSLTIGIKKEKNKFSPIFLPIDADEQTRHEIAAEIHQGAVEFATDYSLFADIFTDFPDPTALLDTISCLLNFDSSEKQYLENIKIPFGLKNEKKRYLITPKTPILKKLANPVSFFKLWRKSIIKRFF